MRCFVKIVILQESLHKEGLAKQQASVLEKLDVISTLFPQIFLLNEKEYFEQVSKAFGDDPKKYVDKLEQMQEQPEEEEEVPGKKTAGPPGQAGPAQENKGQPIPK